MNGRLQHKCTSMFMPRSQAGTSPSARCVRRCFRIIWLAMFLLRRTQFLTFLKVFFKPPSRCSLRFLHRACSASTTVIIISTFIFDVIELSWSLETSTYKVQVLQLLGIWPKVYCTISSKVHDCSFEYLSTRTTIYNARNRS